MVIYARGGSEGTAVEAESRTGRWEGEEKLSVNSLRLFPPYAAPESQSLYEYNISVCAHSVVHSCVLNKRN